MRVLHHLMTTEPHMSPARSRTCEDDAGRAAGFHDAAGWRELAGRLIDSEGHDVVALEVCCVEQSAGRIEREKARRAALRRLPRDRCKPSAGRIDAQSRDAVLPTVRHVDKIARR